MRLMGLLQEGKGVFYPQQREADKAVTKALGLVVAMSRARVQIA